MRKSLGQVLTTAALALALLLTTVGVAADEVTLKAGHPERYVVKKGDTLWAIAGMFLSKPWQWPQVWQANPQIKNPHLIYPGDQLRLVYVDGEPRLLLDRGGDGVESNGVTRLSPQVRVESLKSAIETLPAELVGPYLIKGRIVTAQEIDGAARVIAGPEGRLLMGAGDRFVARGLPEAAAQAYAVFRNGEQYVDPDNGELLGIELIEVGRAGYLSGKGEVATLQLDQSAQEVRLDDRLLPMVEERVNSSYLPSAPANAVDGKIIAVLGGVQKVGRYSVVALNRGRASGLEVGNTLAISKKPPAVRDRQRGDWVDLPAERVGLLMVFRTFDKMSYALVLESSQPGNVGDLVSSP